MTLATHPSVWLNRARSACHHHTLYWAGAGGEQPNASHPGSEFYMLDARNVPNHYTMAQLRQNAQAFAVPIAYEQRALRLLACDCSGFVCWALGLPCTVGPAGLKNESNNSNDRVTTAVLHHDALGPNQQFVLLSAPRVGCLVVYPKPKDGAERYGHVAFVSALGADGQPSQFIDCSAAHYFHGMDAIAEGYTDVFQQHAASRYIWPKWAL